ncbi:uncharacterized protein K444DRAFT_364882 [Hyaloscypha bicolor E]|uniref:Uncharacterized protein n=1 Tax=Hyaloscypha bicolor E TaxID=1095630 RepID=A0A2J6TDZ3_9HELO|nr:uncharacterized protein K444DRAFT_364882 [Hyaloscypha bicolor E]PMD61168.1 hypothetical protein K444DRAFT_364882 [Hyaloscypha bicolor E]
MISRRGRYQSWSSTGKLETSLGFPSRLLRYHVPGLKTWSGKQLFLGVYVTSKERREERGARAKYRVPR